MATKPFAVRFLATEAYVGLRQQHHSAILVPQTNCPVNGTFQAATLLAVLQTDYPLCARPIVRVHSTPRGEPSQRARRTARWQGDGFKPDGS